MTSYRFAVIGTPHCEDLGATDRFEHSTHLLKSGIDYDAVIVSGDAESDPAELERLRRTSTYALKPLFTSKSAKGVAAALSDGAAPESIKALEEICRSYAERLSMFNRGRPPLGLEAKVLAYLWMRGSEKVLAVRDAAAPQFYQYPLIDALADEPVNAAVWLQGLAQRGLLHTDHLIDRIRLCSHCGSGRLNYIDVCVECQSMEIRRQPSLHCFTCGHVGHQEQFLKDGTLVCPNCMTRLRHIGTDYDRPLENYHCNNCSAFFVDADVEARCLDCGTHHTPDQLHVREIRDYALTESGMLACRQGLDQTNLNYFGQLSMVGATSFKVLLDWQLELIQRHKAPSFVLLGVRFRNLAQTLARLGEQRGHALLDTLVERMQEAIRDTDRCTRTSEEHLWLLLMHTDQQGIDRVSQRLEKLSTLFVGDELQDIALSQVACVAPRDVVSEENAELLLARLTGEL
ncbi:diguanylate cyclase domain-containing protein [Pseudomonas matsuisoli]|uniref:GGDEF domain-containing protein n=1 Tax=Pseudomonas matsuisoli TaxID=1515666 RepID=A0A917PLZ7_9PSED|nr:diguanylate cyclase [Pseudomonas matsuisoli]GGJ83784.1 hypothetical protein GCM10009304_07220 [Pseudomonas matsuisoli]